MAHPVEDASDESPFGAFTQEEFYSRHSVIHRESFMENKRGMKIFTQSWIPEQGREIGVVGVIHGFTGESSWLVQLTCIGIAKMGFGVYALDHQGHGFSEGLRAHIPDINPLVDDCIQYFDSVRDQAQNRSLPAFLYAESLGGAIALLLHLRQKEIWSGVVLNGAMCGISDKFKPPWPLEHLLSVAAALMPTWQIVPTKAIPNVSFKEDWKCRLAISSPRRTLGKPRAATALELIRVCKELQSRFSEITLPLLIVHGGGDVVCDPECVRLLYEKAGSVDKTLRIYEGMWHQLVGEPRENVEIVFGEIYSWLRERATKAQANK